MTVKMKIEKTFKQEVCLFSRGFQSLSDTLILSEQCVRTADRRMFYDICGDLISTVTLTWAHLWSLQLTIFNNLALSTKNISLVAQTVKNLPMVQETQVQSLSGEGPLEKEMTIHSSILAWEIPWTEEPGRLKSVGSQRVRHDWATNTTFT